MSDEVRVTDRGAPPMSEAGSEEIMPSCSEADRRVRALEADLAHARLLLHEADHRAKNTLQVVTSLVLLQARRVSTSPEPRVLYAIAERINALSLVHRLLAEDDGGRFPLALFLREIVDEMRVRSVRVETVLRVSPLLIGAAKAPSLGLLVHEVLANAYQHAFPDGASGRVTVSLAGDGERCVIGIEDDGVGYPAGTPDGFGLMLVGLLGRQLRATVTREPGEPGTRVTIAVPAA